jgi:circadian clock protein KaiB
VPNRRKISAVSSSTAAFEAAARATSEHYVLRLYVAGTTPGSARAVENLRRICDELLAGRYDLEVVDVYQDPARARDEQIIAVPTLVKKLPAPLRRILGDLSDREQVLVGLDLKAIDEKKPASAKKTKRRQQS